MGKVNTITDESSRTALFKWENVAKADGLLRAINHQVSQKLLQAIYRHQQVSLVTLCKELGPQQENLSRLLHLLHAAGYLDVLQKGRTRLYSVNEARLHQVFDLVNDFV